MGEFFGNIIIAVWAFTSWYLAGLGPSVLLFPRCYHRYVFLLAPLVGLSLLTLIDIFQITVLLMPLTPRINVAMLAFITLIVMWVRRDDFRLAWREFYRHRLIWLFLPPFVLLIVFAWLFHNGGFHLLTGGSDQLQYCQNARQILEEMHTRSAHDMPVPRQDHFVYEMYTRTLPYIKSYRRGAEVMLATVASVTTLSYEEAFPVTILCALLTLGLTLGFIGRFFHFSLLSLIALQAAFLGSFYLLQAHIQGSLALILSIAPGLVSLILMSRMVSANSWRWLFPTGIILAAYLSIYSEPALISIILPSVLLVIWQYCRSWREGFTANKRVAAMYFIVGACSPFAVYSIVINAIGNLLPVYHQFITIVTTDAAPLKTAATGSAMQIWTLSQAVMGGMSYYDTSAFNNQVSQFVANAPWVGCIAFIFIGCCALLGYVKIKNRMTYLFAAILLVWMLINLILAKQQDYLRFMRSLQYAMPFILIGLILLASRFCLPQIKSNYLSIIATRVGKLIVASFVLINLFTIYRTTNFITSHYVNDDPILLRYNERSDAWHTLQNELRYSALHNRPVLLSGFRETIRPTAIAMALRSQPHVLGTSILAIWPIYKAFSHAAWPYSYTDFHVFNTRFSEKEFQYIQNQETLPWSYMELYLIKNSLQAVVPVGGDYPEEWKTSKDVFAPKIKRFPNIGDVVYRYQFAVTLKNDMISPLKQDESGPFRLLLKSGPVMIHDQSQPKELTIHYEGKVDDVKLRIDNHDFNGQFEKNGLVSIKITVSPKDMAQLNLLVTHPVKLRSITLT